MVLWFVVRKPENTTTFASLLVRAIPPVDISPLPDPSLATQVIGHVPFTVSEAFVFVLHASESVAAFSTESETESQMVSFDCRMTRSLDPVPGASTVMSSVPDSCGAHASFNATVWHVVPA